MDFERLDFHKPLAFVQLPLVYKSGSGLFCPPGWNSLALLASPNNVSEQLQRIFDAMKKQFLSLK